MTTCRKSFCRTHRIFFSSCSAKTSFQRSQHFGCTALIGLGKRLLVGKSVGVYIAITVGHDSTFFVQIYQISWIGGGLLDQSSGDLFISKPFFLGFILFCQFPVFLCFFCISRELRSSSHECEISAVEPLIGADFVDVNALLCRISLQFHLHNVFSFFFVGRCRYKCAGPLFAIPSLYMVKDIFARSMALHSRLKNR